MADKEKDILEEVVQDTEQDFLDAFEEASNEFSSFEDTFNEDTDGLGQDSQDTDEEKETDTQQEEESSEGATAVAKQEESQDDIDWKALYDRASADASMTKKQLKELEAQFYSWRGRVEAEKKAKELEQASKKQETPNVDKDLEDLNELFPELASSVQKLIDARVTEKTQMLEQKFQQELTPVKTRVQQAEAQAHEAAILNAHPDLYNYLHDGSFKSWVDSLPPYKQAGAQYVSVHGTADEIIQLFNDFKQETTKTVAQPIPPKNKSSNQESIVNKVQDALAVRSEMSKAPDRTSKEPTDPRELFDYMSRKVMLEG